MNKSLKKIKIAILSLLIVAFVASNLFVVYTILQRNNSVNDSNASTSGKLVLALSSPSNLINKSNGTTFSVALSAQNTSGSRGAEIVLSYDKNYIEATGMNADSSLIGVYQNIDNTNGRLTIDIAKTGSEDLQANATLVTFNFTIKNNNTNTTVISVNNESTLGTPNTLSGAGYGALTLTFKSPNICGDGILGGSETCDSGSSNGMACSAEYNSTCQYCTSSCQYTTLTGAKCGDSIINGSEQCDVGTNGNSTCSSSCTIISTNQIIEDNPQPISAICGNGDQESGEQCDDGNSSDEDSCSSECLLIITAISPNPSSSNTPQSVNTNQDLIPNESVAEIEDTNVISAGDNSENTPVNTISENNYDTIGNDVIEVKQTSNEQQPTLILFLIIAMLGSIISAILLIYTLKKPATIITQNNQPNMIPVTNGLTPPDKLARLN